MSAPELYRTPNLASVEISPALASPPSTWSGMKNIDFKGSERDLIAASVVGFNKSCLNSHAWSHLEL